MTISIPFVGQSSDDDREWLPALQNALPDFRVAALAELSDEEAARAELAIVTRPPPNALQRLSGLRWVQSLWAGVEGLLADESLNHVAIVRLRDPMLAQTMADSVLGWTLFLQSFGDVYGRQQRERRWAPRGYVPPENTPVGVLGLGELGQASVRALRSRSFPVFGWSRREKSLDRAETFAGRAGLDEVLRRSRVLVCLLPLTAKTRGLIGDAELGRLPRGASLIHVSRGPVIETGAILRRLDDAHLRHAVLDVFDEEPLPESSRLWAHDRVTVLPHVTAPTYAPTAAKAAAANVEAYFRDGIAPPSVSRELGYEVQ